RLDYRSSAAFVESVTQRTLECTRGACATQAPIAKQTCRRSSREFQANNVRREVQGLANVHKRVRPGTVVCGDPVVHVQIKLTLNATGRAAKSAQIVGRLAQHAASHGFLRR